MAKKHNTMQNILLSPFEVSQLQGCVDLYQKVYSNPPWNECWDSQQAIADFICAHTHNNYFLGYVALKAGDVVGVSLGFIKPWAQGMEYYIDEFYISPDLHRQGVGTQLMFYIKRELKAKNINAIILNTKRGYPSQQFYESMGFKVEPDLIILNSIL